MIVAESVPSRAPQGTRPTRVRASLPDPRLPRSPRVRDHWSRMARPALVRRWDLEPVLQGDDVATAIRDLWEPWARRCQAAYGQGDVVLETQDWPRVLIATYRPHTTTRRA